MLKFMREATASDTVRVHLNKREVPKSMKEMLEKEYPQLGRDVAMVDVVMTEDTGEEGFVPELISCTLAARIVEVPKVDDWPRDYCLWHYVV